MGVVIGVLASPQDLYNRPNYLNYYILYMSLSPCVGGLPCVSPLVGCRLGIESTLSFPFRPTCPIKTGPQERLYGALTLLRW